jgi:hypothetical protein
VELDQHEKASSWRLTNTGVNYAPKDQP